MKNKINQLREYLYKEMESNNYEKILKISKELDQLIIQYSEEEKHHKTNQE